MFLFVKPAATGRFEGIKKPNLFKIWLFNTLLENSHMNNLTILG